MLESLKMFALSTILLVVGSVLEVASGGTNYCSIKTCSNEKEHTMCLYPNSGPANTPGCEGYTDFPLTADERRAIVDSHNSHRKRVANGGEKRGAPGPQPSASNMHKLEWNDELAKIAQRWADQCISQHDECRDVEGFQVGQNIAYENSSGSWSEVTEMVNRWYEEVKLFNENVVSRYQPNEKIKVGHYTQMVWAKTKLIGCGRRLIKDSGWNRLVLICNYGPTGNWKDQPIYKRGDPASECPGEVSNIVGLCA